MQKPLKELISEYEESGKYFLEAKRPVIIRLDGRCFTKLTKKLEFEFPYCDSFNNIMNDVTHHLCKNIPNCVFATRHSDEISLLLCDFIRDETQPAFGNSMSKIISLSSAMATGKLMVELLKKFDDAPTREWIEKNIPHMDARCFNIDRENVIKYFFSRKIDAERNNISAWARNFHSHNKLDGLNSSQKKELLETENDFVFDALPGHKKYGFMLYRPIGFITRWVYSAIPDRFDDEFFNQILENGEIS